MSVTEPVSRLFLPEPVPPTLKVEINPPAVTEGVVCWSFGVTASAGFML